MCSMFYYSFLNARAHIYIYIYIYVAIYVLCENKLHAVVLSILYSTPTIYLFIVFVVYQANLYETHSAPRHTPFHFAFGNRPSAHTRAHTHTHTLHENVSSIKLGTNFISKLPCSLLLNVDFLLFIYLLCFFFVFCYSFLYFNNMHVFC